MNLEVKIIHDVLENKKKLKFSIKKYGHFAEQGQKFIKKENDLKVNSIKTFGAGRHVSLPSHFEIAIFQPKSQHNAP